MALFQYICKHAAAILQGTEITGTTQEDHQMLVVCRTILRDIALTHWELGLKNCARTKESLYNLSDSLRG
jgi:hypothetical protein